MLNNILNIEGATVLSREKQKMIKGGEEGTCAILLYGSAPDTWGTELSFAPEVQTGISRQTALDRLADSPYGGRWCCDSCDEASWLQ